MRLLNKQIIQKVDEIFIKNNGFATTKQLMQEGILKPYIYELYNQGILERLSRGLYKLTSYEYAPSEIVEVIKIIPRGVICLASALSFYNLTTYNPSYYQVAIKRDSKVTLPEYPPIKLVWFSDKFFEEGIEEIETDSGFIRIYNREKTICDCIRYRNKIGNDIVFEAIREYMRGKEKNINKLIKYAEICRVKNIIKNYIEVLL